MKEKKVLKSQQIYEKSEHSQLYLIAIYRSLQLSSEDILL